MVYDRRKLDVEVRRKPIARLQMLIQATTAEAKSAPRSSDQALRLRESGDQLKRAAAFVAKGDLNAANEVLDDVSREKMPAKVAMLLSAADGVLKDAKVSPAVGSVS